MVAPSEQIPLLEHEVALRQARRNNSAHGHLWDLLDDVCDPEIPVVSLWELGVLQDIQVETDAIVVYLTPTYSGCPALSVMCEDVTEKLRRAGHAQVRIQVNNSPVWGTHYLSEDTAEKLRLFHIAAPATLACPNCNSPQVSLVSEFSGTACKALYSCGDCLETFEYFKPI